MPTASSGKVALNKATLRNTMIQESQACAHDSNRFFGYAASADSDALRRALNDIGVALLQLSIVQHAIIKLIADTETK